MRPVLISFQMVILFSGALFMSACGHKERPSEKKSETFVIRDFVPLANWKLDTTGYETSDPFTNKLIYLDYTDARKTGFIIPAASQTADGFFDMEFYIKNLNSTEKSFCYKIYYQNESYKFPERDPADSMRQHPFAHENFYGSWEEPETGFAETGSIPADGAFHKVSAKFRIAGNPRNEQRYFREGSNDRWKRNPRTGNYAFLLVVTTLENIQQKTIPEYIQNISMTFNGQFVTPWFYFLYGAGKSMPNTLVSLFPHYLKVVAKPDPGAGIYLNPHYFNVETHGSFFSERCGQNENLDKTAQFDQFVHYIDPSTKYYNIPVIADVLKDNYSKMEYNWNRSFYTKEELVAITATTTSRPCETVISDPVAHKIIIKNPATEFGKWEKQNTGVITRHGFAYGKYTVKAKLTELLNRNNMWNGLTNAIWLITMDEAEWNFRRDCNNVGYMANYYGGQEDKRVKSMGYSEIDFEILKTVPYCPGYVLPPAYNIPDADQYAVENWNVPLPEEILASDGMIQVACTNWDMACKEPKNFRGGCEPIVYNDQVFWLHRWDENYRAITSKVPEADDELFGSDFYYFQIDWQPERIIWRIGPSKDKLRVVGFVDETVTSIPNNQMLLIITQEFHNTRWWVGSMYAQDNIPFPKNDIVGEIYELTIE